MNCETMLRDFLATFFAHHYKGNSVTAMRTYRNAVDSLEKFLGRPATLADLNDDTYEPLKTWLDLHFKAVTNTGKIARIRTLWRAANAAGLVETLPPSIVFAESGLPECEALPVERKPTILKPEPTVRPLGTKPKNPREFIEDYALERGLSRRSIMSFHHRLGMFEKFLGRPAEFTDFEDRTINLYIAHLLARGLDPETVKGYRMSILCLWRSAFLDHALVPKAPGRIRKLKIPFKPPRCWSVDELIKLITMAGNLVGVMRRDKTVRRADFWVAFILLDYSTALRLADMMALRWDAIDDSGAFGVVQAKTGDEVRHQLTAQVMAALEPLRSRGRERVFGDLMRKDHSQEFFRRIVRVCGLKGSIKWLRRSGATHCEIANPGSAMAFLGHRTPGLAFRNYLDQRLLQSRKSSPPPLDLQPLSDTRQLSLPRPYAREPKPTTVIMDA